MANNDRNDRGRGDRNSGEREKPWGLFLIVPATQENRDDEWVRIGAAWKNSKGGFTWTQHVQVPFGARLGIMPPKQGSDR